MDWCFHLSHDSTMGAHNNGFLSLQALERLDMLLTYKQLTNELRLTARALLANQQGGMVLNQMSATPQQPLRCTAIMGVVVHTALVFFGRQEVNMLLPFVNILSNPAALNVIIFPSCICVTQIEFNLYLFQHSFLPTMPEDQLMVTQVAMRVGDPNGVFYGMALSLFIRALSNNKLLNTLLMLFCQ